MVEEMPEPIGGMYAIQEKIKYPEIANEQELKEKFLFRHLLMKMEMLFTQK